MVCESGIIDINLVIKAIPFDQFLRLQVKNVKKSRSRSKGFSNTEDNTNVGSRSKLSTRGDRSPFRNVAGGIMGGGKI